MQKQGHEPLSSPDEILEKARDLILSNPTFREAIKAELGSNSSKHHSNLPAAVHIDIPTLSDKQSLSPLTSLNEQQDEETDNWFAPAPQEEPTIRERMEAALRPLHDDPAKPDEPDGRHAQHVDYQIAATSNPYANGDPEPCEPQDWKEGDRCHFTHPETGATQFATLDRNVGNEWRVTWGDGMDSEWVNEGDLLPDKPSEPSHTSYSNGNFWKDQRMETLEEDETDEDPNESAPIFGSSEDNVNEHYYGIGDYGAGIPVSSKLVKPQNAASDSPVSQLESLKSKLAALSTRLHSNSAQ